MQEADWSHYDRATPQKPHKAEAVCNFKKIQETVSLVSTRTRKRWLNSGALKWLYFCFWCFSLQVRTSFAGNFVWLNETTFETNLFRIKNNPQTKFAPSHICDLYLSYFSFFSQHQHFIYFNLSLLS